MSTLQLLRNSKGKIKISHLLLGPVISYYWFFANLLYLLFNLEIPQSRPGIIIILNPAKEFYDNVLALSMLLIIYCIYLWINILKRKSKTKVLFIVFFIASFLFSVYLITSEQKINLLKDANHIIFTIYIALSIVWIFYFIFSKRVRETFDQKKKERIGNRNFEHYKIQKNSTNSHIPAGLMNANNSESKFLYQKDIKAKDHQSHVVTKNNYFVFYENKGKYNRNNSVQTRQYLLSIIGDNRNSRDKLLIGQPVNLKAYEKIEDAKQMVHELEVRGIECQVTQKENPEFTNFNNNNQPVVKDDKFSKTSHSSVSQNYDSRSHNHPFYVKKNPKKRIPLWMMLIGVSSLILAVCFIFFNNPNSSSTVSPGNNLSDHASASLRFNDYVLKEIREKTKNIRLEIHREHRINILSELRGELLGICKCKSRKEFLFLLEANKEELTNDIFPCIPVFIHPEIISHILEWLSNLPEKYKYQAAHLLTDELVNLGDEAVEEMVSALNLFDDDKVKSVTIRSLALIGTKKSIIPLIKILNGDKDRAFYYAAQNIQAIASNENLLLAEAFNFVKKIYTHPQRIIRKKAIEAMSLFQGREVYDFLLHSSQDFEEQIRSASEEQLDRLIKSDPALLKEHSELFDESLFSTNKGIKIDNRLVGSWEMADGFNTSGYMYYFITFDSNGEWSRRAEFIKKTQYVKSTKTTKTYTKKVDGSGTWQFSGSPLKSMTEIKTTGGFMVERFTNIHNITFIDENTIGIDILSVDIGSQIHYQQYIRMKIQKTEFQKISSEGIPVKIQNILMKLGMKMFEN